MQAGVARARPARAARGGASAPRRPSAARGSTSPAAATRITPGSAPGRRSSAGAGSRRRRCRSLELSRYELELAPAGSWVVCVSNSGKVVAHGRGGGRGARERGLLRDRRHLRRRAAGSRDAAEVTLAYRYDDPGFGPGTISYVASLGALYALARAARPELGGPRRGSTWSTGQAEATARTIELAGPVAERLGRELPGRREDRLPRRRAEPRHRVLRPREADRVRALAGRRARAGGVGARGVLLHRPRGDDDRRRAARRVARPRGRAARGGPRDRRDRGRRLPARRAGRRRGRPRPPGRRRHARGALAAHVLRPARAARLPLRLDARA